LLERKKVVPIIDRRYYLSETVEAMRYFEKGQVKGKVIIKIVS
jgi:NADPH:quinone reductase-like Zn-dependent oxidoreductase